MKTEAAAFVLGILIVWFKRMVVTGIESVIGQRIGQYILGELSMVPRIAHYVARHSGKFGSCHDCKPQPPNPDAITTN